MTNCLSTNSFQKHSIYQITTVSQFVNISKDNITDFLEKHKYYRTQAIITASLKKVLRNEHNIVN